MYVQIVHIISPTDIRYYRVDPNKCIEEIETYLSGKYVESETKVVLRGCKTPILHKSWPLKFYDDTFYIEPNTLYIVRFQEFNREFNVYMYPSNISRESVKSELCNLNSDAELMAECLDAFYLEQETNNILSFTIDDRCAYYKINISNERDSAVDVVTKEIICNQCYVTIRDVLTRLDIFEVPFYDNIENFIYKIEINGEIITDISIRHPKTINNMKIYTDRKKYTVKYLNIEYTGGDGDILHLYDENMFVRKDTNQRPISMKFEDICGACTNVELEFNYNQLSPRTIIYIRALSGTTITLCVNLDMHIDELKHMICVKKGIPESQQCLLFSGRSLEKGTLLENNIYGDNTLHLVLRLHGGGSSTFVDISKGMKARSFSKDGPHWRTCRNGLFLRGYCTNSQCKAYLDYVVMNKHHESFDLKYDKHSSTNVCPECNHYVVVKSFGFCGCKYKIHAEFSNGEKKIITDTVTKGYIEPNVTSSDETAEYTRFTLSSVDVWDVFEIRCNMINLKCDEKEITAMITKYSTCPICYDLLDSCGKKISITNCNHIYCTECISSWIDESKCDKCPMCRTNIDTIYS